MEAAAAGPALAELRGQLAAAAARQQRFAQLVLDGQHAADGLTSAEAELLAELRRTGGAAPAAAAAADGAEAAAAALRAAREDKERAVEQVKAKAKAGFVKLRAESQQTKEELAQARRELELAAQRRAEAARGAEAHEEAGARLRAELETATAALAAADEQRTRAVDEVKAKAKQRFVELQAQASERSSALEEAAARGRSECGTLQAQLEAEAAAQLELRAQNERQAAELEAARADSRSVEAARGGQLAQLQSRLDHAQHELGEAQSARDAALAGSAQHAAEASRLEAEHRTLREELLSQQAAGSAENARAAELSAELQALRDVQQRAALDVGAASAQRGVLEQECERHQAELASKQKKIKSLQREVKRLEQLARIPPVAEQAATHEAAPAHRQVHAAQADHAEGARLQQELSDLRAALEESNQMVQLQAQQEQLLKQEIRDLDVRQQQTAAPPLNMEYLRSIVLGYIEDTGDRARLLPVLAELLQFGEAEVQR